MVVRFQIVDRAVPGPAGATDRFADPHRHPAATWREAGVSIPEDGGGGSTGSFGNIDGKPTAGDAFTSAQDGGHLNASITDMHDYAFNLYMTGTNAGVSSYQVLPLMESYLSSGLMTPSSHGGGVNPECALVAEIQKQHNANFTKFFSDLMKGLQNIGQAAQVIADSYQGTDARSAADVNCVNFAFADPDAKRPKGLPSSIGKTTDEIEMEQQASLSEAQTTDPDDWASMATSVDSASGTGYSYATYTFADGSKVSATGNPTESGTGTVETITITDASGRVISKQTTTQQGNTETVNEETTTYDGKTPSTSSHSTTTVTNADGSEDITIKSGDSEITQKVPASSSGSSNDDTDKGPMQKVIDQGHITGDDDHTDKYGNGY